LFAALILVSCTALHSLCLFIQCLLYVRKEIAKASISFSLSASVTVTQQFKIIQPHVATENASLITKTFEFPSAQHTCQCLSAALYCPAIPRTLPVPLIPYSLSTWLKLGLLWIGCYAIWGFYLSLNVLQLI